MDIYTFIFPSKSSKLKKKKVRNTNYLKLGGFEL